MPETLIPQFNYPPSPLEMAYRREQAKQTLVYDPDVQDIIDMPYGMGPFLAGTRPSLVGAVGTRLGYAVDSFLNDSGDEPLNFAKERQEADPIRDPLSFTLGNNLDGITEDLASVPVEERGWILSAPTYAEYQRRLMFIKMGLPEAQAQASGYGTAFGIAADISALAAAGIAAEGVAVAGLGTRGALAGRTAASAFGKNRSMELATAAAEAAASVGRLNLTARWVALGVAEEAVFQAVKNGVDPLYDPTAGDVVQDLVISGTISGVLGGAVFGRMFVKDRVEEAALELRRKRVTNLPGGYTVDYGPGYIFDSPAAADQMLFSMGTGSFAEEASKVGSKLWDEWDSSPVEAVFTTRLAGEVLPPDGTAFRYTTTSGDAFDVLDTGALRASGAGDEVTSNRVYFVSSADMNRLSAVMETHRRGYPGVPLSAGMNADGTALVLRETGGTWTGRARTSVKASTAPRPGAIPVQVDEAGQISFGGRIKSVKETPKGVQPFRSVIKSIAFEISLAGGPITRETFAMIAKALTNVERRGLMAGAFNKAIWEEVSKSLPSEVAAKLRKNKAFIGGADRTVMDLVDRETMIDTITGMFRRNVIEGVDDKNSLIFHVLREIRNRGGVVNRKVVEEVVDTLRGLAQAPPTKVNKAGKTIIDKNSRRLGVAQLINKHAKSNQQVFIPPSLMNNMKPPRPPTGGGGGGAGTGAGGGRAPSGTDPDFSDVPKVNSWWDKWWAFFGNQAARLMRSDNGAARLIGHHAFHAKRVFDKAQPQTIFEAGTQMMHTLLFSFLRSYRQGWVKFALGDAVDAPTIKHTLKTFGKSELRAEFNTRVMRQLRSGLFDDASESVNETAKHFRELFKKVHELAHAAGLKGFQGSAIANYAPRLWRFDRIRRLATTDEGRKALIQLVKKAIDQNGRRVVIDGVEQTIKGDIDEAATVFANRLIAIAKGTEGAPLIEQEQELADALMALKAPLKGKGPTGGTPFGRARTILDEGAAVSTADDFLGTGRRELSLDDLTNNDLPAVMRKYLTSIMGAVNQRRMITAFNDEMRARGVFGPKYVGRNGNVLQNEVEVETVEQMIELAKKVGGEIEEGAEAGLRELMEVIRYDPIHKGPMNVGRRVLNLAMSYGYLTSGGQFGLAQLSELSRLVGTLGIKNMIRQMPILGEMINNWRNLDRDADNLSSLLDSWFAPSTDRIRRVFMDGMTATDEFAGGVTGVIERGINSASQVLSDISGLAPIQSFTQQLAAAGILQHLYDVARAGTKRLDEATVRALGLEPTQYEQIIQFVGRNAKTKKGLAGERIVGMDNIDAKDMDLIKGFVQRFVESRIQSVPTRGDLHKSAFTAFGRLLTQFRTFNLKGVDNFLIQNVERARRGGGSKVAQEIAATLMFAGLIQHARTRGDYYSERQAGNWERADQLEKQLTVVGFIRGAFTGPSEFFVPAMMIDTGSKILVGDPIFSPYRYSGLNLYGFPGQALAENVGGLLKDAYGRSVGQPLELKTEREITTGTIRKARLLLPGQNLPILKQYLNILEGDIEDEYMLRRRQPRRPAEPD